MGNITTYGLGWTRLNGSPQYILDTNDVRLDASWREETVNGRNRLHVIFYVCSKYRINGNWDCSFSVNGSTLLSRQKFSLSQGNNTNAWASEVLVAERYIDLDKTTKSANINLCIHDFDYLSVTTGGWTKKDFTQSFSVSLTNTEVIPGKPVLTISAPNNGTPGRSDNTVVQLNGNGIAGTFRCYAANVAKNSSVGNTLQFGASNLSNAAQVRIVVDKFTNGSGWTSYHSSGWVTNVQHKYYKQFGAGERYNNGVAWRANCEVKSSTGNIVNSDIIYFVINDVPAFGNNNPNIQCSSIVPLGQSSLNVSWSSCSNTILPTKYKLRYKKSTDGSWSESGELQNTNYTMNLSNTSLYPRGSTVQFEVLCMDDYDQDSYRGSGSVKINSLPTTATNKITSNKDDDVSKKRYVNIVTFTLPQISDNDNQTTNYKLEYNIGDEWINYPKAVNPGQLRLDCTNYQNTRGGMFKLRATPYDGMEYGTVIYSEVLYKNRLPEFSTNTIVNDKDNKTYNNIYEDNVTFTFPTITDPDQHRTYYNVEYKVGDGIWQSYNSKYTSSKLTLDCSTYQNVRGGNFQLKVTAYDGMEYGESVFSRVLMKNTKPTTPTNLLPTTGHYVKTIPLSWTASTDIGNTSIYYNVYINNELVNITRNNITSFNWPIPFEDPYNTKYLFSIEAIDNFGIKSDRANSNYELFKGDDLTGNISVIIDDVNRMITNEGYKYYNFIQLSYSYDNKAVPLNYEIQYAEVDKNFSGDVTSVNWQPLKKSTSNTTHQHSIEHYTNDNLKLVYRVRGILNSNQYTKWGYSDYCNIYINDNTDVDDCCIVYPVNNSTIYTKLPYFCINFNPKNSNNYWLCITINGQEYNNIFKNVSGKLVAQCSQELVIGRNTITICEKSKLTSGGIFTGPVSTTIINLETNELILEDIIKFNQFNLIIDRCSNYKLSYGLNQINKVSESNPIIRFDYLNNIRSGIDNIVNTINNFYNPNIAVSGTYTWKKYNVQQEHYGYTNPHSYGRLTTNDRGPLLNSIYYHTNYKFVEGKGFFGNGQQVTSANVGTKYCKGSVFNESNQSPGEVTTKVYTITKVNGSNDFTVDVESFICDYQTRTIKGGFVENVTSTNKYEYPDNGAHGDFWYERVMTIHTWDKYNVERKYSNYRNPRSDGQEPTRLAGGPHTGHSKWWFDTEYGFQTNKNDPPKTLTKDDEYGEIHFVTHLTSELVTITKKGNPNESWRSMQIYDYDIDLEKGSFIETVQSTNVNEYPDNSIKDNYWYVRKTETTIPNFNQLYTEWEETNVDKPPKKSHMLELIDTLKEFKSSK